MTSANQESNADLFFALKGGSNNFGVITRFDMSAFPSGDFWGGNILYDDSVSPELVEAFSNLDLSSNYDEHAALILSFSSVAQVGEFASANIEYTKPTPNPPIFDTFTSTQPQLSNTMRISNQTDFVTEFVEMQPSGRRQMYVTNTFRNDLAALQELYAMSKSAFKRLPQQMGVTLSFVVQPIPPATTSQSALHGGNMLGLSPDDGALVLCLFALTWDNPADDAVVQEVARTLDADAVQFTKSRGLWHRWVYLNYAAEWQDPITGYGEENKLKLQETSKKYDPHAVFQRNVPGGFKLFT